MSDGDGFIDKYQITFVSWALSASRKIGGNRLRQLWGSAGGACYPTLKSDLELNSRVRNDSRLEFLRICRNTASPTWVMKSHNFVVEFISAACPLIR
jgi:hypothetical protein